MNASAEAPRASCRVVEAQEISALLDVILESGYRLLGPTVMDGAIVYDEIASAARLPGRGRTGTGERPLPAPAPRRRRALRIRRRAARLEEVPLPRFPAPLRRDAAEEVARDRAEGFRPAAGRVSRREALRRRGHRAAGPRLPRRPVPGHRLRGAARGCPRRRRPVRRGRGHVLLLLHGHRPARRHGVRPRPHGAPRRRAARDPRRGRHAARRSASREAHVAPRPRGGPRGGARSDTARRGVDGPQAGALRPEGAPRPASAESPRWEEIAGRCLSCANCTMVCPTCFCATVEDASDLTGASAERWRRWDSCHTLDFSYIHGGSIRRSVSSRYRQWMTHKLATWVDQFGETGCVGCGRCITWCPVGIDLTEEARALQVARPAPAA